MKNNIMNNAKKIHLSIIRNEDYDTIFRYIDNMISSFDNRCYREIKIDDKSFKGVILLEDSDNIVKGFYTIQQMSDMNVNLSSYEIHIKHRKFTGIVHIVTIYNMEFENSCDLYNDRFDKMKQMLNHYRKLSRQKSRG